MGFSPLNDWHFGNSLVITWSTFPMDLLGGSLDPLTITIGFTVKSDNVRLGWFFGKSPIILRKQHMDVGKPVVLWFFDHPTIPKFCWGFVFLYSWINEIWEDVVSWTLLTCVCKNVWRGQLKICGFQHSIRSLFLFWLSHGFPKDFWKPVAVSTLRL